MLLHRLPTNEVLQLLRKSHYEVLLAFDKSVEIVIVVVLGSVNLKIRVV